MRSEGVAALGRSGESPLPQSRFIQENRPKAGVQLAMTIYLHQPEFITF
jgi:hypothetical protein